MKRIVQALAGALIFAIPGYVFSNPVGGFVVPNSGSAVISHNPSDPNHLIVQQDSSKAIINWQSFSNTSQEITQFIQPNASSITLNRVIGPDASKIDGSLRANGNVWIVNSRGIEFGANARVDVGGLLATTANISDQDFMRGHYHFLQESNLNSSVVVQQGAEIKVKDTGMVALVAPGVSNRGLIVANLGKVNLGSGLEYTVDLYGDNLIHFAVAKEPMNEKPRTIENEILNDAVRNSGHIIAHGGKVVLSASQAKRVVEHVINMDGIIEANTAIVKNNSKMGEIILLSSGEGKVLVSGKMTSKGQAIDANGTVTASKGGTVKVLGEKVALTRGAIIDVSGNAATANDAGGGKIFIGGSFQGQDLSLRHSDYTAVEAGAKLIGDGLQLGKGGEIVIWSNNYARFYGEASAMGGIDGGIGGLVETSGAGGRASNGGIDLGDFVTDLKPLYERIKLGRGGTWLLDPETVTVTGAQAGGTFVFNAGTNTETWTPTIANSTILNTNINGFLDLGQNVTINTFDTLNGNISVIAPISHIAIAAVPTLTFNAGSVGGNISFSGAGSITSAGQLSLSVNAGSTSGTISVGAPISVPGGTMLTFSSGGATTVTASISPGLGFGGGVLQVSANGINWSPGSATQGALLVLDAQSGQLTVNNDLLAIQASNGFVSLAGASFSQASGITLSGGNIQMNFTQNLSLGAITVSPTNAMQLIGNGISMSGTSFSDNSLQFAKIQAGAGAVNINANLPSFGGTLSISAGQSSTIISNSLIATMNISGPQLALTTGGCNLLGTIGGFTTQQSATSPILLTPTNPNGTYLFGGQNIIVTTPTPRPTPTPSSPLTGTAVIQAQQGIISAMASVTAGLGGGGGFNQANTLGFLSSTTTEAGGTVTTETSAAATETTTTTTGGGGTTTETTTTSTTTTTTTSTTTTSTTTTSTTTSTTTTTTTSTTTTSGTTATSTTTTATTASSTTTTTSSTTTTGGTPTAAAGQQATTGAAGAPSAPGVSPGTPAPAAPTAPNAPLTPSQTASFTPMSGREMPGIVPRNLETVPNPSLSPFGPLRPPGTIPPGGIEAENTAFVGGAGATQPIGYADNINRTPVISSPMSTTEANQLFEPSSPDYKNLGLPAVAPAATTPETWASLPAAGHAAPSLKTYSEVEGYSGSQVATTTLDYFAITQGKTLNGITEIFFPPIKPGTAPLKPTETAILDSVVQSKQ